MIRHRRNPAPVERILPGLARIQAALAMTGSPEQAFPAIHVAGTNGKGSTSVFAASILGLIPGNRIGLYTSPHLLSPNERIRVDGAPIPAQILDTLLARAEGPLSWFERMTWAAFRWFNSQKVTLAVLETGLGGRFDATNVCRPSVCAVTTIGIDHVEWLGGTIREIAGEKAGIFKPGVPVILGRLGKVARSVLLGRARDIGAPAWELGRDFGWETVPGGKLVIHLPGMAVGGVRLKVAGAFQNDNASVACAAAWRYASDSAIPLDVFTEAARKGLSDARWPGRLSPLPGRGNRGAWADGAHNIEAAQVLASEISRCGAFGGRKPVVAVWSMLADKNIGGFVRAMSPAIDRWVAYPLQHERAAAMPVLIAAARRNGATVECAEDFDGAWRQARKLAGPGGAVIVCGSLVAVADAYSERVGHI